MILKSNSDSVVDEIHRVRHEIAERFDGDVSAIAADADARAKASGRPIWKPAETNKNLTSQSDAGT